MPAGFWLGAPGVFGVLSIAAAWLRDVIHIPHNNPNNPNNHRPHSRSHNTPVVLRQGNRTQICETRERERGWRGGVGASPLHHHAIKTSLSVCHPPSPITHHPVSFTQMLSSRPRVPRGVDTERAGCGRRRQQRTGAGQRAQALGESALLGILVGVLLRFY